MGTGIEGLRQILPEAQYVTEEGTISKSDGLTDPGPGTYWIIDPLDGTTNFIHGLPIYAVSVGLLVEGEPVTPTGSVASLRITAILDRMQYAAPRTDEVTKAKTKR